LKQKAAREILILTEEQVRAMEGAQQERGVGRTSLCRLELNYAAVATGGISEGGDGRWVGSIGVVR
jgi:hypothetical protein